MDSKSFTSYSFGFTHPLVVLDPPFGDPHFDPSEIWWFFPSTISHQRSRSVYPNTNSSVGPQILSGCFCCQFYGRTFRWKRLKKAMFDTKPRPYYKGRCHCLTVAGSIKYNRGWYTKQPFLHTELHQFLQMKLDLKRNTYPYNPSRDVTSDFHPKQHQPPLPHAVRRFDVACRPTWAKIGRQNNIQISRNDAE